MVALKQLPSRGRSGPRAPVTEIIRTRTYAEAAAPINSLPQPSQPRKKVPDKYDKELSLSILLASNDVDIAVVTEAELPASAAPFVVRKSP